MEKEIANYQQYLKRRYPESSTSKHYVSDLGIFRQFVGATPLRQISLHTIDAFIEQQTHNRRLAAISGFFEFLIAEVEDDHWHNPVRWKRHSIRTGHRLPRDVSDETVTALFGVIDDDRDRAIFTVMVKAGLRVGESVALNLEHLELPDQDGPAKSTGERL